MTRAYCQGCGYEGAGRCFCPDEPSNGSELEASARYPGMGFAAQFNADRAQEREAFDRGEDHEEE